MEVYKKRTFDVKEHLFQDITKKTSLTRISKD